MKSNVVLSSSDRELFGITIKQNTKGEFLSVTDLQKAYEIARWQYGWSERKIERVTQTNDFRERLFYVLESQGFIKTTIGAFVEMLNKEGFTKTMKGLGVWQSTGTRGTNQVMCNPYIWVLIALEMNPMIYAKVIVWLTDSLIFQRIEAGTEYMPMNSAIKSIMANPDYPRYAKAINERVFGQHQSGMRNLASSKELRKISDIEKFIIQSIDFGFLRSENDVLNSIKNFR